MKKSKFHLFVKLKVQRHNGTMALHKQNLECINSYSLGFII